MIKIWRPPHVAFAANILAGKLREMGVAVCIVDKIKPFDKYLYIIYNASSIKRLPLNYIVYQTEVAGSKWFSKKYQATLQNALAIWEYNPDNITAYKHLNSNIHIVTPGVEPQNTDVTRDIPLLFYGYIKKSAIRLDLLNSLKNEVDIKIIENELMTNMWDILSRTAVVLNIHYYENAPLETFRINEALSFGCNVISQTSSRIPEGYNKTVSFADNRNDILRLIKELANPNTLAPDPKVMNGLSNDHEIELAMEQPLTLRKPKSPHIVKRLLTWGF